MIPLVNHTPEKFVFDEEDDTFWGFGNCLPPKANRLCFGDIHKTEIMEKVGEKIKAIYSPLKKMIIAVEMRYFGEVVDIETHPMTIHLASFIKKHQIRVTGWDDKPYVMDMRTHRAKIRDDFDEFTELALNSQKVIHCTMSDKLDPIQFTDEDDNLLKKLLGYGDPSLLSHYDKIKSEIISLILEPDSQDKLSTALNRLIRDPINGHLREVTAQRIDEFFLQRQQAMSKVAAGVSDDEQLVLLAGFGHFIKLKPHHRSAVAMLHHVLHKKKFVVFVPTPQYCKKFFPQLSLPQYVHLPLLQHEAQDKQEREQKFKAQYSLHSVKT